MNPMAMRWGKLYKSTPSELALEDAVAALGVPYRGQFPGYLYGFRYFPDFLLPTLGVVLEVDDASHNRADKMLADDERTDFFHSKGWQVARCTNEEARNNPRGAVRAMLQSVGKWPIPPGLRPVAMCLPVPGRAPTKARRAAKRAATVAKRQGSSSRRSAPRRTPRAPSPKPQPTPTPQAS